MRRCLTNLVSVAGNPFIVARTGLMNFGTTSDFCVESTNYEAVKCTTGWVQSIRKHKTKTFLDINDGSSSKNLQVVCSSVSLPEGIAVGSAIKATGQIVVRPKRGQSIDASNDFTTELVASIIDRLSPIATLTVNETNLGASKDSLVGSMSHSMPKLGLLRSEKGLAWRHRLPQMAAMLRLRAACKSFVHKSMQSRKYLEVDTPILTTTDCEGAGETFLVTPTWQESMGKEDIEGDKAAASPLHLTVSAQLHLEALALGMSKVYTLSPTFRAEPSHSRFHLAEFLMLEAESVQMDATESLCDEVEGFIREFLHYYFQYFDSLERQADLGLVLSSLSETVNPVSVSSHLQQLKCLLSSTSFPKISFDEASGFLERSHGRGLAESLDEGLSKSDEKAICAWVGDRPVFVTDFPSSQKPFYCAGSKTRGRVSAVDLLVPGIGELVGGSVRETDSAALEEKMCAQGLDKAMMSWYVGLRGHGGAPTGGFGLGFDRLLLWTLGVYNIRDTVPFPREMNKMFL